MAYLSYAAFDPVLYIPPSFSVSPTNRPSSMLHHANVDRIFAIWQAMHPGPYLTPLKDLPGTFAIPPGTIETSSTPLLPFSQGNGGWYTSDSCRSLTTLGYTYPEIDDWDQNPQQLQQNVTSQVNTLYNPNGQFINKRDSMPGQQTVDWSVDLRVDKFDCQGQRFVIRLFLGAVPENLDWFTAPGCVGSFRISPPPYNGPSPFPEVLTYSEISLAKGLSDNGINGEDVEGTAEFLKGNLIWIIQKV
jgi:tyrosinase